MSEAMDRAEEIREAQHGHSAPDPWARRVALLVSILAVGLALTQLGEKALLNRYLTYHIALSNDWAFYQARNLRAVVRDSEAHLLASLPNAASPEIQTRIKDAQDYAARMRDDPKGGEGMKQLAATAKSEEDARNEAFHRYHDFEYSVGAIEIAIVLASVSIVTRTRGLTIGAAVIGFASCVFALAIAADIV